MTRRERLARSVYLLTRLDSVSDGGKLPDWETASDEDRKDSLFIADAIIEGWDALSGGPSIASIEAEGDVHLHLPEPAAPERA